jgi:hypothetical protein
MFEVSVIICTHNPHRKNLDRTLDALRMQTLPTDRWELLVVDNASAKPVAEIWDLSWHRHGRHVLEEKLGLSSARQCGILQSSGRLLIFVDDDNVLAPNYLAEALRIENELPFLGTWGSGAILLEFEKDPPEHIHYLLPWLGLRRADRPLWSNVPSCSDATPIGAGLCIRRDVGLLYVEHCKTASIQISGRKGTSLGAHEDFEICYLACKAGFGMGIFPELEIQHLIVKERVSDLHMLKLVESVTLSNLVLAYKWYGTVPKAPFSLRGVALLALNIVRRRGFDRRVYLAELRAGIAAGRMFAQGEVHPPKVNHCRAPAHH